MGENVDIVENTDVGENLDVGENTDVAENSNIDLTTEETNCIDDEDSDTNSQFNLNDNDFNSDVINKNIEEVSLNLDYLDNNPVKLKTHADIYHEIWKLYKDEAYKHRRENLKTYLNSRNIISNTLINEL